MIKEVWCPICHNYVNIQEDNTLVIKNVPESTFEISDKTVDLHIADCNHCGCVWLYNTSISENYLDVYRSLRGSSYREDKKEQLKKFIEQYELHGKDLIEIGCGDGQFLEIFKELGLDVKGIESGDKNSLKALSRGFDIKHNSIYDNALNDNFYDAVFCFHYLEHIDTPNSFIARIYTALKENGIALIEVPDYDTIEKNNIWLEFTKDHRIYYRRRTLTYLLTKQGFEILSMGTNIDTLCLTAVIKKPEKNNFKYMKEQIEKDINKFKNVVDNLKGDFLVWGAGHYSQLILNLFYDKYKIKPKRIFDSNKQKCGNRLLDVVVEHKDNLDNVENCSCVIICGIYNDEVYKSLQNKNFKEVIKWN